MKWSRFLLLACVCAVQAEPVVLDDLGVEAQQRSLWCWASVSVMAINSFDEEGDFQHLTQAQVVARRKAGANNLVDAAKASVAKDIKKFELKCKKPGKCNIKRQPLLYDIESDFPAANQALSMAAIAHEIGVMNHPIIIRWSYAEDESAHPDAGGAQHPAADEDDKRAGAHALLITGFDEESMEIRVFDPLPMGAADITRHEKWIPFAHYLNPEDLEGIRVDAFHAADQYRMRRAGHPPEDMNKYPKVTVTPQPIEPPAPGGFEPVRNLVPAIAKYMGGRVFRQSNGHARTGAISHGAAFPVVAIRSAALLRTRGEPESLLVPRTATYVVPVIENGTVVDSFALARKGNQWVESGYSNNQLASLAERVRARSVQSSSRPDDFYIVSIPEFGAFYVAHGFGAQARLVSLDNDARGRAMPAGKALGALIAGIEQETADWARDEGHKDPPPRPIQIRN